MGLQVIDNNGKGKGIPTGSTPGDNSEYQSTPYNQTEVNKFINNAQHHGGGAPEESNPIPIPKASPDISTQITGSLQPNTSDYLTNISNANLMSRERPPITIFRDQFAAFNRVQSGESKSYDSPNLRVEKDANGKVIVTDKYSGFTYSPDEIRGTALGVSPNEAAKSESLPPKPSLTTFLNELSNKVHQVATGQSSSENYNGFKITLNPSTNEVSIKNNSGANYSLDDLRVATEKANASGVETSYKALTPKEIQYAKEANRILPFDYLTKKIPELAGNTAKDIINLLQIGRTNVEYGGENIPQKVTIGNNRSEVNPKFALEKTNLSDFTQKTIQTTTALAQFAIPYAGEGLFLGTLLERPILRPEMFKQQFLQNPIQTSVLYGLGLISVVGGISSALKYAERVQLENEINNAKINFFARASPEEIRVFSNLNVRGQNFITQDILKNILEKEGTSYSRGSSVGLKFIPTKHQIEAVLREVGAKSKLLNGEVRNVKDVISSNGVRVSIIDNIKDARAFISEGVGTDKLKVLYDSRKGFNIKNGNEIEFLGKAIKVTKTPYDLVKNNIVGYIKPTELENIFKVVAGEGKYRIYKNNQGVSYVFNPKIEGWLEILPDKSALSTSGNTILVSNLNNILASTSKTLRETAAKSLAPTLIKLKNQASEIKKVSKLASTSSKAFSTPLKTISIKSQVNVPSKSLYEGTNQYERTNEVHINVPKAFSNSGAQSFSQKEATKLKSQSLLNTESRLKQLNNSINISRSRSKTEEGIREKIRQQQQTSQMQQQAQRQVPRLESKFKSKTEEKLKEQAKLKIPTPSFNRNKQRNSEFKDLRGKGYDTYIKEKGKFVRINAKPFATKEQALGFGFARSRSNLKQSVTSIATNRAKPFNSTTAKAEFNRLNREFRPSKKFGESVRVERNPLSTKTETSLIQKAKQNAKPFAKRIGAGRPPIRSIK